MTADNRIDTGSARVALTELCGLLEQRQTPPLLWGPADWARCTRELEVALHAASQELLALRDSLDACKWDVACSASTQKWAWEAGRCCTAVLKASADVARSLMLLANSRRAAADRDRCASQWPTRIHKTLGELQVLIDLLDDPPEGGPVDHDQPQNSQVLRPVAALRRQRDAVLPPSEDGDRG